MADEPNILTSIRNAMSYLDMADAIEARAIHELAASGAPPEQIATLAIDFCLGRFVAMTPQLPGAISWNATPADLARAAVEALRLTGHLPKDA